MDFAVNPENFREYVQSQFRAACEVHRSFPVPRGSGQGEAHLSVEPKLVPDGVAVVLKALSDLATKSETK